MDVNLHPTLEETPLAADTASAIEACVHCGFCLATCPTYLDSRDERDSPRGRIYLIKDLLETGSSDATARSHLDRCLGCRSCETTCPSGVRYGHILDGGRALLEVSTPRPVSQRILRTLLLRGIPQPRLFAAALELGRVMAPLLPATLRRRIPPRQTPLGDAPDGMRSRQVILLDGCVQAATTPNSNLALRKLLARLDVGVVATPRQGCCGALSAHLGEPDSARQAMRRNIDAWWPAIEAGAEAILSSATGCGVVLGDYATYLRDDPDYAARATTVARLHRDAGDYLLDQPLERLGPSTAPGNCRVAVHVPCSQLHGLGRGDTVSRLLRMRGYTLCRTVDAHLCCGSAGTYSLLQPAMSQRLRQRKLDALCGDAPDVIASANVGCQLHLAEAAAIPVRHWAELLCESVS